MDKKYLYIISLFSGDIETYKVSLILIKNKTYVQSIYTNASVFRAASMCF
jgi:hypothetical protein